MAPQKMSSIIILAIREDCAAGMTPQEAALKYGLALGYIHKIIRGDVYPEAGGPCRPRRARLPPGSTAEQTLAEARRRLQERSRITESGCWLWIGGGVDSKGYARLQFAGKLWAAHRLSFVAFNGTIPAGYEIDHNCHTTDPTCFRGDGDPHRRCVAPSHLVAVPHSLNVQVGRCWATHGLKTACPQGHPYDEANTHRKPLKNGGFARVCRTCGRDYMRARRAAERAGFSDEAVT